MARVLRRTTERHERTPDAHLCREGLLFAHLQPTAMTPGQQLDALGTDVVASAAVLGVGVAEADDQELGRGTGALPATNPRPQPISRMRAPGFTD